MIRISMKRLFHRILQAMMHKAGRNFITIMRMDRKS